MPPDAHIDQTPLSINSERLSFPLRLLIQIVTFAIVGVIFVVRIESKLSSVETRIAQISADMEKRSDKADAIHAAQGADLSNHNVRISVIESALERRDKSK